MFSSRLRSSRRGFLGCARIQGAFRASRGRSRPTIDALEPRCLLTITTTQGLPVVAVEGGLFNGAVAKFTDTGAGALSSIIVWGDGTSNPGAVVPDPVLPGVFDVLGIHVYSEEGTYAVTVSVRDTPPVGAPSDAVAASIGTIIDAPLAAAGFLTPTTVQEGIAFSGPVGTFTDVDPIGAISDYTATINWGDGSSPSTGVITQPSGPGTGFIVSGSHTFEEGSFPVSVTIKDVGGSMSLSITTFIITDPNPVVAAAPANPSTTEGQTLTAPIGAFTDPNPKALVSDFSATINWGDASAPTVGAVSKRADGTFVVSGSHMYIAPGTDPVTFTITDVGGGTLTAAAGVTVAVADAPLSSAGATVSVPQGTALPATTNVATFTDAGVSGPASNYTATVDWGDGTAVVPASTITSAGSANGVTYSVNGGHTYVKAGVYAVTVRVTDVGGSLAIAHGVAVVGDVPPTATPMQPRVSSIEGVPIQTAPIATFVKNFGTPPEPIGAFTATIDWGDGSPRSTGIVTQPGGPGAVFIVLGSHTYADAGVNNGVGTYPITVTVFDDGAKSVVIQNTASIADIVILLSGQLSPSSDSGKFNNDGITNINTPTFFGKSEAGSRVTLFETPTGGGPLVPIGQAVADANGNWTIASSLLGDGSYVVSATAVDQFGHTTAGPVAISTSATGGPLVIDTVGPRVTNEHFDRLHGVVFLTFQDDRAGMLLQSLGDAANYSFNKQIAKLSGTYIVTSLPITGGANPTDPQTVGVVINNGAPIRGGFYNIVARAASVLRRSGIQDLAGNALDGEFYGTGSASGNGVPGGDFVANIDAFHNLIFPPKTVIGFPHPNDPAGLFATKPAKTTVAFKPAKLHK